MAYSIKTSVVLCLLFITVKSHSQVSIGNTNPQGALDIDISNDGLLIPRVALVNTATSTINTPTESELVYNTASVNDVTPGFYYWNGTRWIALEEKTELETWQTATLNAPAVNFGSPHADARYYKENSRVYLSGLINNATSPNVLFTLPEGYRPDARLAFTVMGNDVDARVDVFPTGEVFLVSISTGSGYLSFDGISFRAD